MIENGWARVVYGSWSGGRPVWRYMRPRPPDQFWAWLTMERWEAYGDRTVQWYPPRVEVWNAQGVQWDWMIGPEVYARLLRGRKPVREAGGVSI